jgi:N-acetylmuramoyl-L-alanine amidase
MKRTITQIVLHCTATPAGRHHTADDIRAWHRQRGWNDIGYHFVVRIDGVVEHGRPLDQPGAHVAGQNARSIGVVYVGGIDKSTNQPHDTRTAAQHRALLKLVSDLKRRFPGAEVLGHRDFPHVAKACPCFDARTEYAAV